MMIPISPSEAPRSLMYSGSKGRIELAPAQRRNVVRANTQIRRWASIDGRAEAASESLVALVVTFPRLSHEASSVWPIRRTSVKRTGPGPATRNDPTDLIVHRARSPTLAWLSITEPRVARNRFSVICAWIMEPTPHEVPSPPGQVAPDDEWAALPLPPGAIPVPTELTWAQPAAIE